MIKIAIPSKGRLAKNSERVLQNAGLRLERVPRQLIVRDNDLDVSIVFIRPKDAGGLVEAGYVDLAVSAIDILAEHPAQVRNLGSLGFGQCCIGLMVPMESSIQDYTQLTGATIATSYPKLTAKWFEKMKVTVNIIHLQGAVEVAPSLAIGDAIVESYETGQTAKVNNLHLIDILLQSYSILIGHKNPIACDVQEIASRILRAASVTAPI